MYGPRGAVMANSSNCVLVYPVMSTAATPGTVWMDAVKRGSTELTLGCSVSEALLHSEARDVYIYYEKER